MIEIITVTNLTVTCKSGVENKLASPPLISFVSKSGNNNIRGEQRAIKPALT